MGVLSDVLRVLGLEVIPPSERTYITSDEYWERARRNGRPDADPTVCHCGTPAVRHGTRLEPFRARCHEHLDITAWSNQGPGGTWVPHVNCTSPRHPGETVSHWNAKPCFRCQEIEERFQSIWDQTRIEGVH